MKIEHGIILHFLFPKLFSFFIRQSDILSSFQVHAYEQMNRVYNYTLDPCGPIYVTVGDGENIETADVDHADDKCPPQNTYQKWEGYAI
ncbi:hypothetical protein CsSME_00041308 [Camellia sinensis var. sinensis]